MEIDVSFFSASVTADEEKKMSRTTQCKKLGCRDYLMKFNFALTLREDVDIVDSAHFSIFTSTATEFK